MFTQATRAWIYRVTTAAMPLLIVYGVVTDETAPLWVGMAAAILGTGTAAAHTPARRGTTGQHADEA